MTGRESKTTRDGERKNGREGVREGGRVTGEGDRERDKRQRGA